MVLTNQDWEDLLYFIEKKKCTPFIGDEALSPWIPIHEWISEWTDGLKKEYGYPVDDSVGLPGVAQLLAIADGSELTPKNNLSRKLERITIPNFSLEKYRNTPYAILADLNLPIYITTNYDHFLEQALKSRGKQPISEFCAWNEELKKN